jgi:glycosyltransferase involved in cell wall biosynthesis
LVANLPGQHGRPFYLVHHDEGLKYGRSTIDSTLALPMTKIVVSTSTKTALENRGASDIVLVPNGINSHLYRSIVSPERRQPGSLLMNWVNKDIKDPKMALAALELVRNQARNISVTFFGAAKRDRVIPDWIRYVRKPTNNQLVETIYNQSAILMCSSKLEGFGFPAAEAMACGCAVATTDCGGVRDFCEHESTALLSRVGDPVALANNILRLISDDELRLRLSREGSRRAATLDWDRSVDELETLFRSPAR